MGSVEVPAIATLDLEAHLEQGRSTYLAGIAACTAALEAGDTWEICLTNRVRLPAVPDPFEFFRWQRAANPAQYAAFLRYGDLAVASSSAERFLTVDADGWAECRPIKGTVPRDPDPALDRLAAKALAEDDKTRAENLIIVDLIRNDLGRVSEPGDGAGAAADGRRHHSPSLHQLVTTVRGPLRSGVTAVDAVPACFLPGSMTGAPKIRTMEILDELEAQRPRRVLGCARLSHRGRPCGPECGDPDSGADSGRDGDRRGGCDRARLRAGRGVRRNGAEGNGSRGRERRGRRVGETSGRQVADSFLVANGTVRGIELHRERFVRSCAAAGVDSAGFWDEQVQRLPASAAGSRASSCTRLANWRSNSAPHHRSAAASAWSSTKVRTPGSVRA